MPKGKRGQLDHTQEGVYDALGIDEERFEELAEIVIELFFDSASYSYAVEIIANSFEDKIEIAAAAILFDDIQRKVGNDIESSFKTGKIPVIALSAFKTYAQIKEKKYGWSVEKTIEHYKGVIASKYNVKKEELESRANEIFSKIHNSMSSCENIRYIQ